MGATVTSLRVMDQDATADYLKHADDLLRFASAVAGPSAADDLVAAVVVRVLVESDHWRSITDLRGYLMRAVMNEAIDRQRSRARRLRRERNDSPHEGHVSPTATSAPKCSTPSAA